MQDIFLLRANSRCYKEKKYFYFGRDIYSTIYAILSPVVGTGVKRRRKGLDKETLRDELLKLTKDRFPHDEYDRAFLRASGLHRSTLTNVRMKDSLPTVENLIRWLEVCGVQPSEFFSALEQGQPLAPEHLLLTEARNLARDGDPEEIEIVRGLMRSLVRRRR